MNRETPLALVLDTTFLLPAFGVEIEEIDSSEKIESTLQELVKSQGNPVLISDLSPLEAFLKAFRLAEKVKSEEGKKSAKLGFLAVTNESSILKRVTHSDESVVNAAYEIRITHSDPFDCFIFATAKVMGARLVTEDNTAAKYLGADNVVSWHNLRKMLTAKKSANPKSP